MKNKDFKNLLISIDQARKMHFIRKSTIKQTENCFDSTEQKIAERGEKQYLKGNGINWRRVKREGAND